MIDTVTLLRNLFDVPKRNGNFAFVLGSNVCRHTMFGEEIVRYVVWIVLDFLLNKWTPTHAMVIHLDGIFKILLTIIRRRSILAMKKFSAVNIHRHKITTKFHNILSRLWWKRVLRSWINRWCHQSSSTRLVFCSCPAWSTVPTESLQATTPCRHAYASLVRSDWMLNNSGYRETQDTIMDGRTSWLPAWYGLLCTG